ncbi:MAG: hypothetical protein R3175_03820 [Marinobacter sp.]|uniref:hypothetical protein n=1 Tax=Marinobacter sp. TaxID=50741 RepID=UPI00299E462B|nr:hypothetical protein [Marinobacter sp.]MDX1755167.1 hypothetical protein [Marinobacter sp.]
MFQLIFKGECAPGTDLATARDNARALFKASLDQIDKMFSGQRVVIRNRLDETQAEKYRAVLHKHGLVAYVEPMAGQPEAPSPRPARPVPPPSSRPDTPAPADTGGRQPKAGAGVTVEPGERLPVAGDKVDDILTGSHLSLDPVGVALAETQEVEPPMFEHLDEWSVAPAGSDIGVERDLPPPVVPDTSHLSLAETDKNDDESRDR